MTTEKKTKQNDDGIYDIDLLINNYCNHQILAIRHHNDNEENYNLNKKPKNVITKIGMRGTRENSLTLILIQSPPKL